MTGRYFRLQVLLLTLAMLVALPAFSQWTTMTLEQRYETFYDVLTAAYKNDVVSLSPDLFGDQVFGNPHVLFDDSGNWIITGYGDSQFGSVAKGDAVYTIKRNTGGGYERNVTPVLSWPDAAPGNDWTTVGAIDAGVGVAKTTNTTATSGTLGGYKYFMLVPVWDMPTDTRWITWAVSTNATAWQLVNQSGTGTTTDPANSLRLIYRSGGTVDYYHPAMVFNPANGYFYISLGFRGSYGGIGATWWRIPFTQSNVFGLHKAAGASRFTVDRLDGTSYVYSDGTLQADSNGWPDRAADPKSTPGGMGYAADPLDLVYLTNSNGTFNSFLFIYKSESGFADAAEAPIYYVRGTQPVGNGNIVFGTPQRLNLSALRSSCYADDPASTNPSLSGNPCYRQCSGAGRGYYLGIAQSGTDAYGQPQIFGFITAFREDLHESLAYIDPPYYTTLGCQAGSAGVLPVRFRLQ